jgi:hypothetical protein
VKGGLRAKRMARKDRVDGGTREREGGSGSIEMTRCARRAARGGSLEASRAFNRPLRGSTHASDAARLDFGLRHTAARGRLPRQAPF